MEIWKFKAYYSRICKAGAEEVARFCGLSMNEQDAEINAYWGQ